MIPCHLVVKKDEREFKHYEIDICNFVHTLKISLGVRTKMRRQITVFMGHLHLTELLSPTIWLCINMSGNSNVVKCTYSRANGFELPRKTP